MIAKKRKAQILGLERLRYPAEAEVFELFCREVFRVCSQKGEPKKID